MPWSISQGGCKSGVSYSDKAKKYWINIFLRIMYQFGAGLVNSNKDQKSSDFYKIGFPSQV